MKEKIKFRNLSGWLKLAFIWVMIDITVTALILLSFLIFILV